MTPISNHSIPPRLHNTKKGIACRSETRTEFLDRVMVIRFSLLRFMSKPCHLFFFLQGVFSYKFPPFGNKSNVFQPVLDGDVHHYFHKNVMGKVVEVHDGDTIGEDFTSCTWEHYR